MRFLILGRSVRLKKKDLKKFFFSMLLLCSFFRLKELFQVKNGVTTSLLFSFFFFFEIAKNLDRSDDGKRRKRKRMAFDKMI